MENLEIMKMALPGFFGDKEEQTVHQKSLSFNWTNLQSSAVVDFCKQANLTPDTFFAGTLSYVLARFNGEEEVKFSTDDKSVQTSFSYDDRVVDYFTAIAKADDSEAESVGELLLTVTQQADGYTMEVTFPANTYSDVLIASFADACQVALQDMLVKATLKDITLLSAQAEAQLDSFFGEVRAFDESQTIVSLFKTSAHQYPDKLCVNYKEDNYTYAQVDALSDSIAAYIVEKGITPEHVVSVLLNRSALMVIISLGVMKAGCAYQPLDPSYPTDRLNFMMKDADAQLLIADRDLRTIVDEYQGDVLYSDEIAGVGIKYSAEQTRLPEVKPDYTYILLYTSGSTGVPKGVMLCHANMVAYIDMYKHMFQLNSDCNTAPYASYGFDAFMMDTYPALASGASIYIVPEEIRLDLEALNRFLEDNAITHTLMTTQVGCQFAMNMENHSLRYLLTGGEKILTFDPPTNYALYNMYGPTETTISITGFPVTERLNNVPVGGAHANMRLYIVDKLGQRVPVGCAGELWTAGPQVGKGYLNLPEKTAEAFVDNPFLKDAEVSDASTPDTSRFTPNYAKAYRTGDTVCWRHDGKVLFLGRNDGQVKIRGFRIELKEVEGIIRQFEEIKDVTVQAFDAEGGGKFIAAYVVSDAQVDIQALNDFIMDSKPLYMVPAVTMQIDKIPLNVNQKVDKKALPKPEVQKVVVEENVAPLNKLELQIKEIISSVIHTDEFGITTPLLYVGLTSITCIQLAVKLFKRFGVKLDTKAFVKTGTLQDIENAILDTILEGGATAPAEAHEQTEVAAAKPVSAPLTFPQQGVYIDCLKDPLSTIYNTPALITLPGDIDGMALVQAVVDTTLAHQSMRLIFDTEADGPVQKFVADMPVEVGYFELSLSDFEDYKAQFVQPFNLQRGPLFRWSVIRCNDVNYLLMDIHHLIVDGASVDLMLKEICTRLEGKTPDKETYSYLEFAIDQKDAEQGEEFKQAKAFFKERLGTLDGASEIAPDLPKDAQAKHMTSTITYPIDIKGAEAAAKKLNVTTMQIYLAAVYYTVSKYTNSNQVCIGTVSNGRKNIRTFDTTGMFVNTLALSQEIGEQTVEQFVREVDANFNATLEHEDYPFAQIAADFGLHPEILFAYQVGIISDTSIHGVHVSLGELQAAEAKFKFFVYINDTVDGGQAIMVDYDNGYYSEAFAKGFAASLDVVVNHLIADLSQPVKSIQVVDEKAVAELKALGKGETIEYDHQLTLIDMLRHQAKATPEATAVVFKDKQLTYREIDEKSDRLAKYLVDHYDIQHEEAVGVMIDRSELLVIYPMAIMKAGGAYMPLDFKFPAERLQYMCEDAHVRIILSEGTRVQEGMPDFNGKVFVAEQLPEVFADNEPVDITTLPKLSPSDRYVLLYTSGSTGRPKGVELEHHNIVNFCHWYVKEFDVTAEDRAVAYANFGFDAHMMDLYPALSVGATVYIIPSEMRMNLMEMNEYMEANKLTIAFITTQLGYLFATSIENHSLRLLSVGGEKLNPLKKPRFRFYNGYGPTECTLYSTCYNIDKDYDSTLIGRPLANYQLYVVDSSMQLLPKGVPGELVVCGEGVGRGYLHPAEKDAHKFTTLNGEKCYRTGDLVRWSPDGNIEYLGRMDNQVKLRGLRIELGEIENKVLSFQGIKQTCVDVKEINGAQNLCCYYTTEDGNDIDIDALKDHLGENLTHFMVPEIYTHLDKLPYTANGKVDRRALPVPTVESHSEYVEPANDTEKLVCAAYAKILELDKVGAKDNYFEIGGTSLNAMKVLIELSNSDIRLNYGDMFALKTPRAIAAKVLGTEPVEEDDSKKNHFDLSNYDYTAINELLKHNVAPDTETIAQRPLGRVLLSGATGFLGIHVLYYLLKNTDSQVIALVRGSKTQSPEDRLKSLSFYYFDDIDQLFENRVTIIGADITNDDLSQVLQNEAFDTVINCAAMVKHFVVDDAMERINVLGVRNLIKLCEERGARLIQSSTCSVGGELRKADMQPLTEDKLFFGQFTDNEYIRTKFMAERDVLQAVADGKLDAKVMRLGNLMAREQDGEFQVNFNTNAFANLLKSIKVLGSMDYKTMMEQNELSPIDRVAEAVVKLSTTPENMVVFQPFNNYGINMAVMVRALQDQGFPVEVVSPEQQAERIGEMMHDSKKSMYLQGLLHDGTLDNDVAWVPYINPYTTEILYRMGFYWHLPSENYLKSLLSKLDGLGFFDE